MAGCGRFIFFINSGNILCTRNNLLNFYQNVSRNASKYLHETVLPPKPKKPPTVFILYVSHVRSKFIQENPSIKSSEIIKKASQEWAELDPMEKKDLQRQYHEKYETYLHDLKEYEDSLTDEQKQLWIEQRKHHQLSKKQINDKRKKETFGKPKKPLTAFFLYISSKKDEKDPNLSYKNWVQLMSKNWKEMSHAEKQPYFAQCTNFLMQYKKDLAEWEMKMINLGHSDIVRHSALTKSKHIKEEQQN